MWRRAPRTLLATVSLMILSGPAVAATDLLGSSRGGSPQWDFCYGKPDATPLPPDPRTLVQPGVNTGRAVDFNAYWKNCHVDPGAVQEVGHATTCGELRAALLPRRRAARHRRARGRRALHRHRSDDARVAVRLLDVHRGAVQPALDVWGGFLLRPDNFDELVAERYGSVFGAGRNPYPLPGEDPNPTNGGSGRLPEMFTQLRNPDGTWSGGSA